MRVLFKLTLLEKIVAAQRDASVKNKKIDRIYLTGEEIEELKDDALLGAADMNTVYKMLSCSEGQLPEAARVFGVLIERDPLSL